MKIEIKQRYNGSVLWSGEAADLRESVRLALKAKANLSYADLSGADLSGADLSGANLSYAESGSICRMDFGSWSICIRENETSIGCQTHTNAEWLKWKPADVAAMHTDAPAWWTLYGPAIKAAIKVVMKKATGEHK